MGMWSTSCPRDDGGYGPSAGSYYYCRSRTPEMGQGGGQFGLAKRVLYTQYTPYRACSVGWVCDEDPDLSYTLYAIITCDWLAPEHTGPLHGVSSAVLRCRLDGETQTFMMIHDWLIGKEAVVLDVIGVGSCCKSDCSGG